MLRKVNLARKRIYLSDWLDDVFRFEDGLYLSALLLECFCFEHDDHVVSSEWLQVVVDEFWLKLFHEIGLNEKLFNFSFVHVLCQSGAIVHSLCFLHIIKFHFVGIFYLLHHPLLRLFFLQHLDVLQYIPDNVTCLAQTLLSKLHRHLVLWVAFVVIGPSCRQGSCQSLGNEEGKEWSLAFMTHQMRYILCWWILVMFFHIL